MNEGHFVGNSKTGNFQEALNNAIIIAKESLKTDLIKWKFEELFGEDGGFVLLHNLSVKIYAQIPTS